MSSSLLMQLELAGVTEQELQGGERSKHASLATRIFCTYNNYSRGIKENRSHRTEKREDILEFALCWRMMEFWQNKNTKTPKSPCLKDKDYGLIMDILGLGM